MDKRLGGLDAVRFAAAMMVVLTHVPGRVGLSGPLPFGPWGGNGVDVFFVLSGYLLWRPFVTGTPKTTAYLVNRAARILPAYWLAVIVLVPLRGAELGGYLLMVPDQAHVPLGVVWTLVAEVQFYLVLPLISRLRRPFLAPLALGAVSLAMDVAMGGTWLHGSDAEALIVVRLWSFVPGMLLAASGWRPSRWALPAGIGLMSIGAASLDWWGGQWLDLASTAGAMLFVAWGISANPPFRVLWSAGAAISYGLYLWHVDLVEVFGLVGIPLFVAAASLSYLLLERPVMRAIGERSDRVRRVGVGHRRGGGEETPVTDRDVGRAQPPKAGDPSTRHVEPTYRGQIHHGQAHTSRVTGEPADWRTMKLAPPLTPNESL